MRKVKILIATILLCVLALALCACDLFGDANGANSSKNDGNDKVEKKIAFSQACDNYEKQEYKKADAEVEVGVTLFLKNQAGGTEPTQRTVAFKSDVGRINGSDSSALSADIKNSENTDEQIGGLLKLIKNFAQDNKDKITNNGNNGNGNNGNNGNGGNNENSATNAKSSECIEYMQDFFADKITLGAASGKKNGTINLKANYSRKKESGETESDGVWYFVGEEFLEKFLGNEAKSFGFADSILANELFDLKNGNDTANNNVGEDGVASYSYDFGSTGVKTFIGSIFDKLSSGIAADKKNAVETCKNLLLGSISDNYSSSRFDAKIGNDKLPTESAANCEVALNCKAEAIKTVANALHQIGIIDESTKRTIKTVAFYLSQYGCAIDGTSETAGNGTNGTIGVKFSFAIKEKYSYGESNCSLGDVGEELFLSEDEEAEGREKLEDVLEQLTAEKAETIIKTALLPLGEEKANAIVAEIKEKLDLSGGVTYKQIKNCVTEVLEKYKDDEEIGEKVKAILEKLS